MPPMFFPTVEALKEMMELQKLKDETMLKLVTFISTAFPVMETMDQVSPIALQAMPNVEKFILE